MNSHIKQNLLGIYAQNAIREHNDAVGVLRLASRLDSVRSKLEQAKATQKIASAMGKLTKDLDKSVESMNLKTATEIMDKFERQFEDLDVKTEIMQSSLNTTTASLMPVR